MLQETWAKALCLYRSSTTLDGPDQSMPNRTGPSQIMPTRSWGCFSF